MLRKPLKRAVSYNMAGIPERTASENSGLMTMSTVMMTPSDTAVSSVSAELIEPRRGIAENHSGLRFGGGRSEEHTSELQSLMRISYAVFCLKKKKPHNTKLRL